MAAVIDVEHLATFRLIGFRLPQNNPDAFIHEMHIIEVERRDLRAVERAGDAHQKNRAIALAANIVGQMFEHLVQLIERKRIRTVLRRADRARDALQLLANQNMFRGTRGAQRLVANTE